MKLILIIIIYIVVINGIGFFMMGKDKQRARKRMWRIKEKNLFLIALIGGSIGSIIGMQHYRHKTKHASFIYGMPAILIIQLLLLFIYCYKII